MSITVNVWREYASMARKRVRWVGFQVDVKGLKICSLLDLGGWWEVKRRCGLSVVRWWRGFLG